MQWWVQDFPDGGGGVAGGGIGNVLFGQVFPQTAWKWKKLDISFLIWAKLPKLVKHMKLLLTRQVLHPLRSALPIVAFKSYTW